MNVKSVLFFLEGYSVPSSRFRVKQYDKLLKESELHATYLYTLPNKYLYCPEFLKRLHCYPILAFVELILIILTRFLQITLYANTHDVILLQRDLLYRIDQPFLERYLFWLVRRRRANRKVRIIFDVDDAIYLNSQGETTPSLFRKFSYICQNCDHVIAGNKHLANYFSNFAPVTVIPTVIDIDRYQPVQKKNSTSKVIAWTGTSGNLRYVSFLENVFLKLQKEFDFKILIISNSLPAGIFQSSELPVVFEQWSPNTELDSLRIADIGIMPLTNTPWSHGKCGFKLLQYMALELSSVASPVGVNSTIIKSKENGLLASSEEEWEQALRSLLSENAYQLRLGRAGRKTVIERYSLTQWFPIWRSTLTGSEEPLNKLEKAT